MPQKDISGRKYYVFEFAAKASTYIRHALAVVTVGNGAFFGLPAACQEARCAPQMWCFTGLLRQCAAVRLLKHAAKTLLSGLCDSAAEVTDHHSMTMTSIATSVHTIIRGGCAGNLYTLTTGSNEFRWGKMKTKVQDVIDSFEVFDKAPSGL